MATDFKLTWAEERHALVDEYRQLHPEQQDFSMEDVAGWAIREDKWHAPRRNTIKLCAAELAKASREHFATDPQGRRIRLKHAVRGSVMEDGKKKQFVFWEDIRNSKPEHMRVSLQQRRGAIVSDNAQLKRDLDSYNENNPHGAHIQMDFDYREDLAELEASPEYGEFDIPDDEGDAAGIVA